MSAVWTRAGYTVGGGSFSPLTSFRSHSRTRSCGTPFPASISASAAASATASTAASRGMSKRDLGIAIHEICHESSLFQTGGQFSPDRLWRGLRSPFGEVRTVPEGRRGLKGFAPSKPGPLASLICCLLNRYQKIARGLDPLAPLIMRQQSVKLRRCLPTKRDHALRADRSTRVACRASIRAMLARKRLRTGSIGTVWPASICALLRASDSSQSGGQLSVVSSIPNMIGRAATGFQP